MKSLTQNIAEYMDNFRAHADQQTQNTMQQATDELISSGIEKSALARGDHLPGFTLPNHHGEIRDSKQLLKTPLIISFYRGGWCPYCNFELAAQQQRLSDIRNAGAELVAISPEQPDLAMLMESKHKLDFDILFDENNHLAKKFGLVFTLPESLRSVYKTFGINIEKYNGNKTYELPIPATYIVNCDGVIEFSYVYADYRKRLEPDILLSHLAKLSSNNNTCVSA